MRVATRWALLFLALGILQSCGGGGGSSGGGTGTGGGGGAGGNSLRLNLATSSLSWSYFSNTAPTAQEVVANATGTYDGTIYIAVIVENDGATNAINPNIPLSISSAQSSAQVTPAANLAAGTYTGRIQFLACSDQACNNRIGGTPLPVPFTITVKARVSATPSPVNATVTSGTPVSLNIAVQPGSGESSFTASTSSAFIQIASQTPGGFTLNMPSLPAGTYQGNIFLTGNQGSTGSVAVNYTVSAPPGGQHPTSVSPAGLAFSTTEGTNPVAKSLAVTEASWRPGLLPPEIVYTGTANWLSVSTTPGGYSVAPNAANLPAGTYTATLYIRDNPLPSGVFSPFPTSPIEAQISMTVGAGLVRPADVARVVNSEDDTPQELSGVVPINVAGGPAVTWNAASSQSWLTVSPSGQTGGNLAYSIDPNWLRNTAVNYQEYLATVTLTVPGSPITPAQFAVRITPQFAEVQGVGPRRALTGQPTRLVVSGRGFAALANPATRVSIPGATIQTVQRINDQKLLVDIQGVPSGTYSVSVQNALGRTPASQAFRAFTVTPPTYGVVPSGGDLKMLLADDERGVVYGLNSNGTLRRFQANGATWSTVDVPVPNTRNFGLMNDGALFLTTAAQNNAPAVIRILNGAAPFTYGQIAQLDVAGGISDANYSISGLPSSLDGKVWLGLTSICGAKLGYFDPVDSATHVVNINDGNCPYDKGPEFAMARNGERMVLWPHAYVFYPAPLVYMDASDRVLYTGNSRTVDVGSWDSMFSNTDGSRSVVNRDFVFNENQGIVGILNVPDYTGPISAAHKAAAIVSPDGTRAYVLAYRLSDYGLPGKLKPRIYVFDTSNSVGNAPLPLKGYFEINDYPSDYQAGSDLTPAAAISMDGRTLYFAGTERFLAVPIPSEQALVPASAGQQSGATGIAIKPWHVTVNAP